MGIAVSFIVSFPFLQRSHLIFGLKTVWQVRNPVEPNGSPIAQLASGQQEECPVYRGTAVYPTVTASTDHQALPPAHNLESLITGLGIDEFIQRADGLGSHALLTDALGSTVALGDNTGTLQTQYTYEPFGYTTTAGQANSNSYKFTGREDDNSGLYYYRARYYHPRLQRFIAEDPVEFFGGDTNLYAYTGNRPTNFTDPSGNNPIGLAAGAFMGGLSAATGAAAQGGTTGQVIVSATIGAIAGGALGFTGLGFDPVSRVAVNTLANLLSQSLSFYLQNAGVIGNSCKKLDINWGSVIGAGVGGWSGYGLASKAYALAKASPLVDPAIVPIITGVAGLVGSAGPNLIGTGIGKATGF